MGRDLEGDVMPPKEELSHPIEFKIPMPRGVGFIVGAFVIFLLVGVCLFFCVLAVANLVILRDLSLRSIGASVIWLFLVGMVIVGTIRQVGIRQSFINVLAYFSRRHFVRVLENHEVQKRIVFGFKLFGQEFFQVIVEGNGIEKVAWHKGQASSLAGRDVNDWSIGVWVRKDALRNTRLRSLGDDPTSIHIVGQVAARSVVEPVGLGLVEFLRGVGVDFQDCGSGRAFTKRDISA